MKIEKDIRVEMVRMECDVAKGTHFPLRHPKPPNYSI